jgi:apolipoprotein D and lipocalin family protein
MTLPRLILLASLVFTLTGCLNQPVYRQTKGELTTVTSVDLQKYLGKWFEIYRLPNWFEDDDCVTVTAEYSLRADQKINVLNTCKKTSKTNEAHGKAYTVEGFGNARLKVSFFWPFYGDYWILDLAEDYSWVIIGEPAGKYLWILARNPVLDKNLEDKLLQKIEALGYRRSDLIKSSNKL